MTSKFHKPLALILVSVLVLTLAAGMAVYAEPDLKPDIAGTYTGTETCDTLDEKTGKLTLYNVENHQWVISDVDYSTNTLVRTITYLYDGTVGNPKSFPFTVNPDGSVSVKFEEPSGTWAYDFLFADNKMTGTETVYKEDKTTIKSLRKQSLTKVSAEPTECTVKVSASPEKGGTVSGGGTFAPGDKVTVKAKAESDYQFDGWYESNIIQSRSESYTFTASGSNMNLVAKFSLKNAPRYAEVKFSELYGEVTIGKMDENGYIEWNLADLDTVIEPNDIIKTEAESGCTLSMSDMTTFNLKENTELTMTVPKSGTISKVDMIIGRTWANIKKMATKGSLSVEMNQGWAGIKGTTFACEETGDTSTLMVFEGEVSYTSKVTGEVVMVKAGERCVADATGRMDKTTFDIEQEAEKWGIPAEFLTPESNNNYTWILIIAGAVIAVVVVVVIIVVAGRKKRVKAATAVQPQPIQQPLQQPLQQAAPQGKFCAGCGSPLNANATFCGKCGAKQQ